MAANGDILVDFSMLELFRMEAENHSKAIKAQLLELQKGHPAENFDALIRAAHSIRGAARIVGLDRVADLAQALEEFLSKIQKEGFVLSSDQIEILLEGNDVFTHIANLSAEQIEVWVREHADKISQASGVLTESFQKLSADPVSTNLEKTPLKPMSQIPDSPQDLSELSMLDLFRLEAENHAQVLEKGLVELERDRSSERVEPLMRAAHSIKGAARIVGLNAGVELAHAMEDVLTAAQKGALFLSPDDIDTLLSANDIFSRVAQMDAGQIAIWLQQQSLAIDATIHDLRSTLSGDKQEVPEKPASVDKPKVSAQFKSSPTGAFEQEKEGRDTIVRITAKNLSRLMGLAGESLIEARSLESFYRNLLEVKAQQNALAEAFDRLRYSLIVEANANALQLDLNDCLVAIRQAQNSLNGHIENLDVFSRRLEHLADRLYNEVIASRMRPFADGIHGFPRMVRDLAKSLDKQVEFQILGEMTKVDRDILEKLEAPLTHLLRNAVDHGLESAEERIAAGKPAEGRLTLEARHRAGMLSIVIADDGRGVDPQIIKRKVVEKGLGTEEMVSNLSQSEIIDFLFLPGFSTAREVSEVSGRGVGLDVVNTMVQEVGGSVRGETTIGQGTRFHLQLPLSLSVIRTILVEISAEPYALPLTRIDRILKLDRAAIQVLEGRQFCSVDNDHIGLVDAHQILRLPSVPAGIGETVPVVVVSDRLNCFGLVVNRFLGERDLVVKPLDPALGKVPNISAAAILEDGSPVLILDVDDVVRSIANILTQGSLQKVDLYDKGTTLKPLKKILVVDDSLTVREVQRRLLENRGYKVELAVDGMDGWNAIRGGHFDLVISDIDMPRMNGIDLVSRIKNDAKLRDIPVMIVSYKDREEDRLRGLQAGANHYLTKSSFHDESLIKSVIDLIGEP